jgi:hypothetical protein
VSSSYLQEGPQIARFLRPQIQGKACRRMTCAMRIARPSLHYCMIPRERGCVGAIVARNDRGEKKTRKMKKFPKTHAWRNVASGLHESQKHEDGACASGAWRLLVEQPLAFFLRAIEYDERISCVPSRTWEQSKDAAYRGYLTWQWAPRSSNHVYHRRALRRWREIDVKMPQLSCSC